MAEPASRLEDNKLLRNVPADVVARIAELCEFVAFDADEMIFDEGDAAHELFLIESGSVRITKRGRGGRQELLAELEPGDFVGEMTLFDDDPRSARATAALETRLARLDRPGLDELLRLAPVEVSRNLIEESVVRLRDTDSRFIREIMEAERLSLVGQMAGTIIHDFKNPMSTILGAAEMIREFSDDERTDRMAGIIRRSIDRMLTMTQELLDYSRGVSRLDLEPVDVDELMDELDEQALARLPERDIRVARSVAFSGELLIDRSRFVRALLNLIKNAAEAMPEGGELTVGLQTRDDRIVWVVADTGCGIPEDLLPTLFDPFVTRGKPQGTGLGMAIVKSIVDAHQGTIDVQSAAESGTRFEIAIPQAPYPPK